MARITGKDAKLYVDEFDFSGVIMHFTIGTQAPAADATAFNDTDAVKLAGKPRWTIGVNGLWSPTSPAYDAEMFIDLTSEDRLVGAWPNGVAENEIGYEGQSNISGAPASSRSDQAITLDVNWRGDDQLARSRMLWRDTTTDATANGTARQHGAIGATQTGVGILRVLSRSGTNPTCDVIIQSDALEAFGTPANQITFAQATAATFERKTVAGAVTDDWWRVAVTIGGTASPTFDLMVAFGIVTT